MTDDSGDPFYPPPPEELEFVLLGGTPYLLIQVRGYPPPPGRAVTMEVQIGGGLDEEDVPAVVSALMEALPVEDVAITPGGYLVQRLSGPPRGFG